MRSSRISAPMALTSVLLAQALASMTPGGVSMSAERPSTFYVSPTGTNRGNGSVASPWSLRHAFKSCAGGAIRPGDTVIIGEGTYSGHFLLTCSGSEAQPIVFAGERDKRVTLDGNVTTTLAADIPAGTPDDAVKAYLASYDDYTENANLAVGVTTGHGWFLRNTSTRGDHIIALRGCPNDTPCAALRAGTVVWTTGVDVLTLSETAHDVWVRGLEITDSGTDSRLWPTSGGDDFANTAMRRRGGITNRASRSKIIDCVVHDTANNVFVYQAGADQEYSGVVTYSSGMLGPNRGHGHNWYIQHNESAGRLTIRNSISLNAFGLLGQIYGSTNNFGHITLDRDVFVAKDTGAFDRLVNGSYLVAGGDRLTDFTLSNSHVYGRPLKVGYGNFLYDVTLSGSTFRPIVGRGDAGLHLALVKNLRVIGNTFFSQPGTDRYILSLRFDGDGVDPATDFHFDHNTYHHANTNWPFNDYATAGSKFDPCSGFWHDRRQPGFGYCAPRSWTEDLRYDTEGSTFDPRPPSGARVTAWVDPYDAARYTVVAYNFDGEPSVTLDVSQFGWRKGQVYRLRNAADYYRDVVSAVYDGSGTVRLPMTGHTVARPNGYGAAIGADTFPEFGVFIVELPGVEPDKPSIVPADALVREE